MDRGFQMLMVRIIQQGRLAELLQSNNATVGIDTFMRTRQFNALGRNVINKLNDYDREALEAYAQGVNTAMQEYGMPWEFKIVGQSGAPAVCYYFVVQHLYLFSHGNPLIPLPCSN